MANDKNRALWGAAEVTNSVDPSADGSTYSAMPTLGRPAVLNGMKLEDLDRADGGNHAAEAVPVQDGGSLDFDWEPRGYDVSSGDGVAAPTADWVDLLLNNAFGAPLGAHGGEGVAASSTTGNLILDATVAGLRLMPVWFAASLRTYWRQMLSASGAPTYTVTPAWPTAPLTADVLYGARYWGMGSQLQAAGATLSMLSELDTGLALGTGGRHSSLTITMAHNATLKAKSSMMFDDWASPVTKDSRPAHVPQLAAPVGQLSPVIWGSTPRACKSVQLNFGLAAQEVPSTEAANGRASIDVMGIDPVINIDPGYDVSVWDADQRAGTIRACLIQFGGGIGSGGPPPTRINSYAFFAPRCQVISCAPVADGQYMRQNVQIRVLGPADSGFPKFTFARC